MPDAASMYLLQSMIQKNQRMLDGHWPPPRGVSLYAIYKENIVLRQRLAQHQAVLMAEKAAKRARLPFPSDLRSHG